MQNNHLGFSWKQFWITFIYENLPPVLISPIAALLIERSWHLDHWFSTCSSGICQHWNNLRCERLVEFRVNQYWGTSKAAN